MAAATRLHRGPPEIKREDSWSSVIADPRLNPGQEKVIPGIRGVLVQAGRPETGWGGSLEGLGLGLGDTAMELHEAKGRVSRASWLYGSAPI